MDDIPASQERAIRARQTVRVVIIVLVLLALVTFALLNTDETTVDWLIGEGEAPLIVVIVVSAGLGWILGAVTAWRRRR